MKKRIRLLEKENEVLRRAAAYLPQANPKLGGSPKREYPLVAELVDAAFPVTESCRVIRPARQLYDR